MLEKVIDKRAGKSRSEPLDQGGNQVASGIYFYRMTLAGIVDTKKMLLIK
ncbi:MAG: hypothetical protein NT028_09255 [candidate division Zixibacteria bacterium]|nr:hypothetical protein [candidate division Zixibacteria bacterium]